MIEKAAKAAVAFDITFATSDHQCEAIVKATEKKGCDLIMIMSHVRRGEQGILFGSKTQKVFIHNKLAELVCCKARWRKSRCQSEGAA